MSFEKQDKKDEEAQFHSSGQVLESSVTRPRDDSRRDSRRDWSHISPAFTSSEKKANNKDKKVPLHSSVQEPESFVISNQRRDEPLHDSSRARSKKKKTNRDRPYQHRVTRSDEEINDNDQRLQDENELVDQRQLEERYGSIQDQSYTEQPMGTQTQRSSQEQVADNQDPLAVARPVFESVAEDDQDQQPIAIADQIKRVKWSSTRVRVCLVALVLILCGAVAGITYGVVSRNRRESTKDGLSTDPSPSPSPSPTMDQDIPTNAPTWIAVEQVGQTLFQEPDSITATGPRGEVYFGWTVDVSSDGQRLVATSPYSSLVFVYDFIDGEWVKSATLQADGDIVDQLALSGNGTVLAVGMPRNSEVHRLGGKVQVYTEDNSGSWQAMGDAIFGLFPGDRLGGFFDVDEKTYGSNMEDALLQPMDDPLSHENYDSSSMAVSEDGQTLAVGSSFGNYVQIFRFRNGNWSLLGDQRNFVGEAFGDAFGTSVDLSSDGETIVIGAPDNIGNADPDFFVYNGHVRVYRYVKESDSWIKLGQDIDGVKGESRSYGEQAGSSVAISSDASTILVGAILRGDSEDIYELGDNDGYVKVYEYDEDRDEWERIGNIINAFHVGLMTGYSEDGVETLVFGLKSEKFPLVATLSGNGKRVAISVMAESLNDISGRGVVRIYELRGRIWEEVGHPIEGSTAWERLGRSIAFSFDGSRLAVGAPQHNEYSPDDGQVQVYEVQGQTEPRNPLPTVAPTSTPAPSRSLIHITVLLVPEPQTNEAIPWTLECDGVQFTNGTVSGNTTGSALVEDRATCQLRFLDWSRSELEYYAIYYGEDINTRPPVIAEGAPPMWKDVVFVVTPYTASVSVLIQLDLNYETAWSLKCGTTTFLTVPVPSEFSDGSIEVGEDLYLERVVGIEEGSLCEFTITDSFGDGLGTKGYYKIYHGNNLTDAGALLVEGGELGLEETRTFTVVHGSTPAHTTMPNPTASPAPSRPLVPITIFMRLYEYPESKWWTLYCDYEKVADVPSNTYNNTAEIITEIVLVEQGAFCQMITNEPLNTEVYFGEISSDDPQIDTTYKPLAECCFEYVFGIGHTVFFTAEQPAIDSSSSLSPTQAPAPISNAVSITLSVKMDDFRDEPRWSLICDDQLLSEKYGWPRNSTVTETFDVQVGAVCQFYIMDDRGSSNGICCEFGDGFYRFYLGDSVDEGNLFIEGGEFGAGERIQFEVQEDKLLIL